MTAFNTWESNFPISKTAWVTGTTLQNSRNSRTWISNLCRMLGANHFLCPPAGFFARLSNRGFRYLLQFRRVRRFSFRSLWCSGSMAGRSRCSLNNSFASVHTLIPTCWEPVSDLYSISCTSPSSRSRSWMLKYGRYRYITARSFLKASVPSRHWSASMAFQCGLLQLP